MLYNQSHDTKECSGFSFRKKTRSSKPIPVFILFKTTFARRLKISWGMESVLEKWSGVYCELWGSTGVAKAVEYMLSPKRTSLRRRLY